MDAREFVQRFRDERDAMLADYTSSEPTTYVGKLLQDANLTDAQRGNVIAALSQALTDAFYTILLGLDGSAALGGVQQDFRILDETGAAISEVSGELEALASEIFEGV